MLLKIILSILAFNIQASDKLVTWMTFDYAPIYQSDRSGFGDIVSKQLQNCLKDFKHGSLGSSSLPRIFKNLDSNLTMYCLAALGTDPVEQKGRLVSNLVFTIPNAFIVVRKNDVERFNATNNRISLKALLKNTKLLGGMVEQGTYGKEVNSLLREHGKNVLKRNSVSPMGFYKMLLQKRFDYFFEYPISFLYHIQSLPAEQRDQFAYLYLEENEKTGAIKAYALCSKASKAVIEKINICLKNPELQKTYIDELVEHLPVDLREDYRRLNLLLIGK